MEFYAGQTFLYPLSDNAPTAHLWVIATEPNRDGLFAFVIFTSLKGSKDQTVILRKNDHPFLKWDTCIDYALAEISHVEKLQEMIDLHQAKPHKDTSPSVLEEIVAGFSASGFTRKRIARFVKEARSPTDSDSVKVCGETLTAPSHPQPAPPNGPPRPVQSIYTASSASAKPESTVQARATHFRPAGLRPPTSH